MADAYTQQSSLDLSQTAYDLMVRFAYRPELYFDQVADVQSTNQSTPGPTVQFTIINDLPLATTALSETTDVSAVSMSDSTISVSLQEYGAAVISTARLRGTSFVPIDPVVANVVGYNAGASIDTIARIALDAGTNVMYGSGLGSTTLNTTVTSRGAVQLTTTYSALDIRVARARLESQNVPKFGGYYMGYIHPDVIADLQGESVSYNPSLGWRAANTYADPSKLFTGEFGMFEGVRFIATPRAPIFLGSGAAGNATLTTALTNGQTAITSLAVTALTTAIASGANVYLVSGGNTQTVVASSAAAVGATTIAVNSFTSNAAYPIGTAVDPAYNVGVLTVTSGSLQGTYTGATPTIGATLTAGTATLSGSPVVATAGGGVFTISGGTVTGSGTVTASSYYTGVNVYGTYVLGRQALAKAFSSIDGNGPDPHIVPGPITDKLRRFVPMGWLHFVGYKVFRQAAIMRIEGASQLGNDVNTYNPAIDEGAV